MCCSPFPVDPGPERIKFNSDRGWNDSVQIKNGNNHLTIKGYLSKKKKYKSEIVLNFEFEMKEFDCSTFQPDNIAFQNENIGFKTFDKENCVFQYHAIINQRVDFSKPFIFKFRVINIFNDSYLIEAKLD